MVATDAQREYVTTQKVVMKDPATLHPDIQGASLTTKVRRVTLTRRTFVVSLGSIAASLAAPLINVSSAAASQPQWRHLGDHPGAQRQPTQTGRTIGDLEVFRGALYAGYGDYDNNTGPININPYSISQERFLGSRLQAYTHQIGVWRHASYGLVAPDIDPLGDGAHGYDPRAGFSWSSDGTTWSSTVVGQAYHLYDFAQGPSDRWVVGSAKVNGEGGPRIWRRRSGGNWATSFSGDNVMSVPNDRYYWIAVVRGTPYTQARYSGGYGPMRLFDHSTQGWRAMSAVNEEFHRSSKPSLVQVCGDYILSASGGGLRIFNTQTRRITTVLMPNKQSIKDLYVQGNTVHTLTQSRIFRSLDGGTTFSPILTPRSGMTAIAVSGSTMYAGTVNSGLWSQRIPVA